MHVNLSTCWLISTCLILLLLVLVVMLRASRLQFNYALP